MVRVRLGPSPTGDPHVGTAYIALFNYCFAKKHGGKLVLRIEDTDQARSKREWETMLVDALHWLGLQWDEGPDIGGPFGPYRQSERGAIYAEQAKALLERGTAYRCFCTAERLAAVRDEAQKNKQAFQGYDGHCRTLSEAEVNAKLADKVPFVIRLKVPREGKTVVRDRLRGEVDFDNSQIDDQVLLKSDGMPTYHLANVVDDHLMQITHVMRAEEWITSTPKHVLLYQAFGWDPPEFIHMPLLRNADKSKISKRKNPVSLNFYREAGILPQTMLNYLGMMGWTMPDGREQFSLDEFIAAFDLDRIHLGGPVFDQGKLSWLNGVYLRQLGPAALTKFVREQLLSEEVMARIAPLVYERIDKLEDFIGYSGFFFSGEVPYDEDTLKSMVPKKRTAKETAEALAKLVERIDAMPVAAVEPLEAEMRALSEEIGWPPKDLFMPVRIAVTGRKATPPLFETMAVLGKEKCRRRLRAALDALKRLS